MTPLGSPTFRQVHVIETHGIESIYCLHMHTHTRADNYLFTYIFICMYLYVHTNES